MYSRFPTAVPGVVVHNNTMGVVHYISKDFTGALIKFYEWLHIRLLIRMSRNRSEFT